MLEHLEAAEAAECKPPLSVGRHCCRATAEPRLQPEQQSQRCLSVSEVVSFARASEEARERGQQIRSSSSTCEYSTRLLPSSRATALLPSSCLSSPPHRPSTSSCDVRPSTRMSCECTSSSRTSYACTSMSPSCGLEDHSHNHSSPLDANSAPSPPPHTCPPSTSHTRPTSTSPTCPHCIDHPPSPSVCIVPTSCPCTAYAVPGLSAVASPPLPSAMASLAQWSCQPPTASGLWGPSNTTSGSPTTSLLAGKGGRAGTAGLTRGGPAAPQSTSSSRPCTWDRTGCVGWGQVRSPRKSVECGCSPASFAPISRCSRSARSLSDERVGASRIKQPPPHAPPLSPVAPQSHRTAMAVPNPSVCAGGQVLTPLLGSIGSLATPHFIQPCVDPIGNGMTWQAFPGTLNLNALKHSPLSGSKSATSLAPLTSVFAPYGGSIHSSMWK